MSTVLKELLRGGVIQSEWHRVPAGAVHDTELAMSCGSESPACTTTPSNNCCSSSTQIASYNQCCG